MGIIDLNRLQLKHCLGGSRCTNVYAYASEDTNQDSVIKCIHTRSSGESNNILEDIVSSMSILKGIVPIEAYDILKDNLDGWRVFIKMPRMQNSMKDIMNSWHNVKKMQMPLEMVIELFYLLASTLEFLERKNIVHRNIKPTNVLFDDDGKLYLSDLGASRFKKDKENLGIFANMKDSMVYTAPEVFARGGLESPFEQLRADVWSLGMLIVSLCIDNVKAIPLHLAVQDVEKQVEGYIDRIEEIYGKSGVKLSYILAGILDADPSKRKPFADVRRVLEHEFLNVVKRVKEDSHYQLIFRTLDEADRDTKRPLTPWKKTRKSQETPMEKFLERGKEILDKLWRRKKLVFILILVVLTLMYLLKSPNEQQGGTEKDDTTTTNLKIITDNAPQQTNNTLPKTDNTPEKTSNLIIKSQKNNYKLSLPQSATFDQEEIERELKKIIVDVDPLAEQRKLTPFMIRCTMFQNVNGEKEVQWYMGDNYQIFQALGLDWSSRDSCTQGFVKSLDKIIQEMANDFAKLA